MSAPRNRKDRRLPSAVQTTSLCKFVVRLLATGGYICPYDGDNVNELADLLTGSQIDPTSEFAVSHLAREILSKYSDGSTSDASYSKARERFFEAEAICKETNTYWWSGRVRHSPHYATILEASAQIHRLLSDVPSLDEVSQHFGFGPGATTRLPRRRADLVHKFSGNPETTAGNLLLAKAALCSLPLWKREVLIEDPSFTDLVRVVKGNKVITVPKNRKTDRTIAIEPCMNIFVQKGFGGVIRNRLRRWNINLNDQTPNQRLAIEGSRTGAFATIDLSMASDTLSRAVVGKMLPLGWSTFLEQARSDTGVFEGVSYSYEKFSSMGNGFTFELETLIFASLARALYKLRSIDGHPVVYGDDIVVASSVFSELVDLLSVCGFSVNQKKSFAEGPFRESCGMHSWKGRDVTPFYIRRPVSSLEEVILLHNNLWRWIHRDFWARVEFLPFLEEIRSWAPAWMRSSSIPDGFGDTCFIGDPVHRRHPYQWDCFVSNSWTPRDKPVDCDSPALLLKSLWLLELSVGPREGGTVFPVKPCGYRRSKIVVHRSPRK